MKRIWLFLLLVVSPAHAWAQEVPACASIPDCIAILRDYEIRPPPAPGEYYSRGVDPKPIERAVNRLVAYGQPSIEPLVELLKHPNVNVRVRAAYVLNWFKKIDPRHLPALIAARDSAGSWLDDAIIATGADEALNYLWDTFLSEARAETSSGVDEALRTVGARIYPRLEAELARCTSSREWRVCVEVIDLASMMRPRPDFVTPMIEEVARSPDVPEDLRVSAEDGLIAMRAPYGLDVLLKRLEAALATPGNPDGGFVGANGASGLPLDWDIGFVVGNIQDYGDAAQVAGPMFVELLVRRDMPEARAAAALALGEVGYRTGATALLAEAPTFEDDWRFAYNAVESLARLGLQEARLVLQRVVETHWNYAVRANAQRALNMLAGGAFDRPDVKGDTAKQATIMVGPLFGDLRYAGDWMIDPQRCRAGKATQVYGQLYAQPVRWPDAGAVVELKLEMPDLARRTEQLPVLAYLAASPGETMFVAKLGRQTLIGSNAGEFGGDVFVSGAPGGLRRLIPDNADAVFMMGQKAMVVTGLSHLSSSQGQLWVVGLKDGRARVERRVRLPVQASGYALAGPDTLVIRSKYGDIGVRADGALVDVRTIAACG